LTDVKRWRGRRGGRWPSCLAIWLRNGRIARSYIGATTPSISRGHSRDDRRADAWDAWGSLGAWDDRQALVHRGATRWLVKGSSIRCPGGSLVPGIRAVHISLRDGSRDERCKRPRHLHPRQGGGGLSRSFTSFAPKSFLSSHLVTTPAFMLTSSSSCFSSAAADLIHSLREREMIRLTVYYRLRTSTGKIITESVHSRWAHDAMHWTRTALIRARIDEEEAATGLCWTLGKHGLYGVAPAGMSPEEAAVLCRGPPTHLQPRFPVGTRVDMASSGGGWYRGTVVDHWWEGQTNWIAGEWVPYQVQVDHEEGARHADDLRYCFDNDNVIREAIPHSPRRSVRKLRTPASKSCDWLVEVARVKEGQGIAKCCAHCGKRCPKNALCRGCKASVFCDAKCQSKEWKHHKTLCKATARGDDVGEAANTALVLAAAPTATPSDRQLINSLARVWMSAKSGPMHTNKDVLIQIAIDTGVCVDERIHTLITNEMKLRCMVDTSY
jgi:hypothetical protein